MQRKECQRHQHVDRQKRLSDPVVFPGDQTPAEQNGGDANSESDKANLEPDRRGGQEQLSRLGHQQRAISVNQRQQAKPEANPVLRLAAQPLHKDRAQPDRHRHNSDHQASGIAQQDLAKLSGNLRRNRHGQ